MVHVCIYVCVHKYVCIKNYQGLEISSDNANAWDHKALPWNLKLKCEIKQIK